MFDFLKKQRLVSASGLGIFRIIFFTVQFLEVFQLYSFKELVFDTTSFIEPDFVSHTYFFIIWLVTLFFIVIGFKTRTALVVNYALTMVYFSVSAEFEYHMDYVYTAVNTLCLFLPLGLSFSVDALKAGYKEIPKVSFLNHILIVFCTTALVYTDSMFHKITSPMWMNGLGMWLPTSQPNFTWLNLQWFLNQKYLVIGMGYLTLLFELTFIFLIWFRKLRPYCALIGLGLHFGIFLAFPIPLFGFAFCGIYFLLLLPEEWYEKFDSFFFSIAEALKIKKTQSPAQVWTGFSEKVLYGILIAAAVLQINGVIVSPSMQKVLPKNLVMASSKLQHNFLRPFLGITTHGVFMDWHFKTARYITVVKTKNGEVLPFFKENGQVAGYPFGRFWVNANFRFLNIQYPRYKDGLKRYTSYWAIKNKRDLRNLDLDVYIKETEVATKWEKDFLTKQMNKPLRKIGTVTWRDYKYELVPVKKK